MSRWQNYDDLVPSERDLSDGWKKMPDLPPPRLVPYRFKDDRRPTEPRLVFVDGMVREAVEELKDGVAVGIVAKVYGGMKDPEIVAGVRRFVEEMEQRTRLRLCLMPFTPSHKGPLVYDDKDGLDIPEVRFVLAPRDGIRRAVTEDDLMAAAVVENSASAEAVPSGPGPR